jgi:hypothetical protein
MSAATAPRLVTGVLLLAAACAPPAGLAATRPLGRVRHEQVPLHLPAAWRQQFEREAARLPALALSDPEAVLRVRDCLYRVPWVDPQSVAVEPDLPAGIRAVYRPRTPRLALARGEKPVALLSADGVVLPDGFGAAAMANFLRVPLAPNQPIPAAGEHVSDALQQEALSAALEALAVRDAFGIAVARIERRFDFPADTVGVPPALSFVCADGREICWGWSAASEARTAPPVEVRVPLETKLDRLKAVTALYPRLDGVSRLVLDRAVLRITDLAGEDLPRPAGF